MIILLRKANQCVGQAEQKTCGLVLHQGRWLRAWVLSHMAGAWMLVLLLSRKVLRLSVYGFLVQDMGQESFLSQRIPTRSTWGLMLKISLQYFGYLMWRTDLLEKTLVLGKSKGRRRRGLQRMRWLNGITDSMAMSLSRFPERMKGWEAWCTAVHMVAKSRTRLSNWTTTANT